VRRDHAQPLAVAVGDADLRVVAGRRLALEDEALAVGGDRDVLRGDARRREQPELLALRVTRAMADPDAVSVWK
jgi:hypothetical protein